MFTLQQLIDSFLADLRGQVRGGFVEPSTWTYYRDNLKPLQRLGACPADTLRLPHLVALGFTEGFTNGFTRALKRIYKWGVEQDLLPKDPFAKLAIPPCGQRDRVLSRAELRRLYRVCSRPLMQLLFVQVHTVARPGEIRQLTWGQIDWGNRVILLTKFKGQKRRRDKTKAKVRAIGLDRKVVRLLRNLYRNSPDKSPEGRVFRSPRYGKPWTYNGVRCAMRKARVLAALDDGGGERVVCYTLRHTGATRAIRAGIELKLVAEMMGHARTTTTERYVHLNATDVVGAADRLSARGRTPLAV